jgi:hypothetical protein
MQKRQKSQAQKESKKQKEVVKSLVQFCEKV